MKVKATSAFVESYPAFIDNVSVNYGTQARLCGDVIYSIVDIDGEPGPSIISLNHKQGETTFTITVDTKDVDEAASYDLYLRVQRKDYPNQAATM